MFKYQDIYPRIEQAKKMLDRPNVDLVNIAIACGFSDQAHFSRTFKKIAGLTPKQYRQNNDLNII